MATISTHLKAENPQAQAARTQSWRAGLALAALTLIGLALRLYHLDYPLLEDEVRNYYNSSAPLSQLVQQSFPDHTPLFFFLSHFALDLFGYAHNPWLLRLPTLLSGVVTIPAIYLLAKEITGQTRVALGVAAATTFTPLMLSMSQYYRMYALLTLLTVLSLYFLLRALAGNLWLNWLGLVVFSVLNLYTHYDAVFVTAIEAVLCALWLSFKFIVAGRPFQLALGQVKRPLLQSVISFGAVGGLYLPWLPHFLNFIHLKGYGINIGAGATPQTNTFYEFISRAVFGFGPGIGLSLPVPPLAFWLGLPLLLVGLVSLGRRRFYYGLFCACYLGLSWLIIWLLPDGALFVLNNRYLVFVTPLYLIGLVQGLFAIGAFGLKLASHVKHPPFILRLGVLMPALILAALLLGQAGEVLTMAYATQSGINEAGAFLKQNLQPTATLLTLQEPGSNYSLASSTLALNFAAIPDTQARQTNHAYLILLDQNTALNVLARTKVANNPVWLAVFLPAVGPLRQRLTQQITQTANTRQFSSYCYLDVCVIGSSLQTSQPYPYANVQLLFQAFSFLDPSVIQRATRLLNFDANPPPALFTASNLLDLSKTPTYVQLPLRTQNSSQTFYLSFKYKGDPSRIFVGAQNAAGTNIAILPGWAGYTPAATALNTAQWQSDGFLFEAPPGTDHAVLALLGENGPAQVEDIQLFRLQ